MKRLLCMLLAAAVMCCAGWSAMADEIEIQPAAIETPAGKAETPAAGETEDAADVSEAETLAPEATEAVPVEMVSLAFEDGFALDLPADWLHYPLHANMAKMGVTYCLSDAAGERWMYVQKWNTDCADLEALLEVISAASDPENSGIREFNGKNFIVYNIAAENVSCCAAMVGDSVLNFVFTPQNDMDFMAQAVQIIGTFREI